MDKSTLKEWGTPHGIAGSIPSLDEKEATEQAQRILFYRMGLSIRGGYFDLFRETHHTDEDVKKAKNWLYINQDVVNIIVTQELA
jgi:hypothetical protein